MNEEIQKILGKIPYKGIVYKIVQQKKWCDEMLSWWYDRSGSLSQKYEIGKTTKNDKELLFAFNTLDDAVKIDGLEERHKIFKCEAMIVPYHPKRIPDWYSGEKMFKIFWDNVKRKKRHNITEPGLNPIRFQRTLNGTVLCSEIIPLEIVWDGSKY